MSGIENRNNAGYTMEKIRTTIADLERMTIMARNTLACVEFCLVNDIILPEAVTELDTMRHPNGPAGPLSHLVQLESLFVKAMTAVDKSATGRGLQRELDIAVIGRPRSV